MIEGDRGKFKPTLSSNSGVEHEGEWYFKDGKIHWEIRPKEKTVSTKIIVLSLEDKLNSLLEKEAEPYGTRLSVIRDLIRKHFGIKEGENENGKNKKNSKRR